jgi:multicomponent Na+:H+ antiporter subunit E
MKKQGSQLLTFILAIVVWLLLTGSFERFNILIGLLLALLVTFKFGETFTYNPKRFTNPMRYLWLIYFLPIFFWEMIKANIDVAYRVLHPKMPINPGLVKIKTHLTSEMAKAFLANAITLTPGTTTVDIRGDEIYVHWIDVKTTDMEEATNLISKKYEAIIARIFE